MSNPLGHSALTSKSPNDILTSQNISRATKISQRYNLQQRDEKISVQFEYMKLQEQYRKQTGFYQQQLDQLKKQLYQQGQALRESESRELQQKQQLNSLHRDNLKLYQENQKSKKLVNTLKSDNQALQLEIQRWKGDRKTYSNKLDSIYELKKNMNTQISQKNSLIEDQQSKIRELEKKVVEYKLKVEELSSNLAEKQRENKDIQSQVKNHLQGYLQTQNLVGKLQHQNHQLNEINLALKDKLIQLEKEKQMLLQRVLDLGGNRSDRSEEKDEFFDNQNYNPTTRHGKNQSRGQSPQLQNIISPADERLMLQIQSFMRQFENLLDRKSQERQYCQQNNQKFINAIECLQKNI